MDPLWFTGVVTLVLVCVTVFYAVETHRIRVNTLRPVFSLATDLHTLGGHIGGLVLVNSGPVARDVRIDIEPAIQGEDPRLFVPALYGNETVRLTTQLQEKREKGEGTRVKLSYCDAVGHYYSQELLFEPGKLMEEKRELRTPESRDILV